MTRTTAIAPTQNSDLSLPLRTSLDLRHVPIEKAVVVVPWSRPAVGDIAAFRTPVAPGAQHPVVVAHRIVDLDDRGFITKGDAATNADWWRVQPQQIEGRVVWWFPMMTLWCSAGALLGVGVTLLLWPARGIPPTADATSYSPHYLLSV